MNLQIFWKIIASEMEFESPSHTIWVREIRATGLREIERFTMVELQDALKHLRRNNCVDSNGIVAECFFHARPELHEQLLPVFTSMLLAGHVIKKGKQTTFSMILKVESSRACTPKTGGPHWAQAWKRNEIWTNCCCKIYYQSRDTENQWYYQSWELATIYASECEYKNFYSYGWKTCETNIGNPAIQWQNRISFFAVIGLLCSNLWSGRSRCGVQVWICGNRFDHIDYNALFDALKGQGGSICIFEMYSYIVSWSGWIVQTR